MAPSSGSRGFTLVETMVALVIIMAGFWAFYEVVVRTMDANDYAMSFNTLAASSQKAVNDIREDLSVAKLIFRNDTIGQGYLAALSLPTGYPILGQSSLPGVREGGIFQQDTSTSGYTGNVLLFVSTQKAYLGNLTYCTDSTKLWPVRIDRYCLVIYYLTRIRGAAIGGVADSLNLVRAYSAAYADYSEVMAVVDPVSSQLPDLKSQVVADLYNNQGIRYLWDTTAAASAAFYQIALVGSVPTVSATPSATYRPPLSEPTEFLRNLHARHTSVSWNTGSTFRSPQMIPVYAYASATGDRFPHGFEVQVIGLSGARQTLVSLSLARQAPAQRLAAQRAQIIIMSKDYH